MTETLYDGRRIRPLTVIDEGNREELEIEMGLSLPSRAWCACSTGSSRAPSKAN